MSAESHGAEDDVPKGVKRPAPDSTSSEQKDKKDKNVHSVNDWEHANLGDDDRKHKFLRLMGASKKEHAGRFVIGDQDKASDRAAAEKQPDLTTDLESQYQQSLEHKLQGGFKGHMGFGYHPPEKSEAETSEVDKKEASPDGDRDKTVSSSEDSPVLDLSHTDSNSSSASSDSSSAALDLSQPDSSASPPTLEPAYS